MKTRFIAVDLDLKSHADLRPFASHCEPTCITTHVGRIGRRSWIRLTLVRCPDEPAAAIRRLAKMVSGLPKADLKIWKGAVKEFDLGFEVGDEAKAAEFLLDAKLIGEINRLGAGVRLTLYPSSLQGTD